MRAFQFLDNRFRSASIKVSKMNSDTYSPAIAGEMQAILKLQGALRGFFQWAWVPVLLVLFLAVKCGLMTPPVDPLKDHIKPVPPKDVANGEDSPSAS